MVLFLNKKGTKGGIKTKYKKLTAMGKAYYQLTFSELNERKKYVNGSAWTTQEDAELEFRRVLKQVIRNERNGFFNFRTDWQLEKIENNKRTVVKELNIWERPETNERAAN